MDKKEFFKLYDKLPKELQDLMSSEKMGDSLEDICTRYNILSYLYEINDYVGNVLLGLLPPDEFEEIIQKELKIKKEKAKKITREINRFVFYPVKSLLEDIYNIEIAPIAKMKVKLPVDKKVKKIKKPVKSDTYRELIDL